MTKKTKAAIDKVEKGGLVRDMILGVATALIGIGAGRTMVKEAATENAVKTLKTDVTGIKAEVSSITAEVETIKTEVTSIATTQKDQDAKLDQILAAIAPASKTTAAPKGTSAPNTKPAPAPTTAPVVTSLGAKPKRVVL